MVDYYAMGQRIRAKRRALKLSQEALAQAAQISISFYGNIERGIRVPSIDTLVAIANALNVGVDALLVDSVDASQQKYTADEARALCKYLRERIEELDYSSAT